MRIIIVRIVLKFDTPPLFSYFEIAPQLGQVLNLNSPYKSNFLLFEICPHSGQARFPLFFILVLLSEHKRLFINLLSPLNKTKYQRTYSVYSSIFTSICQVVIYSRLSNLDFG